MRYRKTITIITVIILSLLIFSSTTRAVTIKDSTVSVDINDKYRWIVNTHTTGAPYKTGDKFNLSVQNIYEAGGYLNIDVILDHYNNTLDTWTTPINGLFLTFNETLDIIQYQVGINTLWGWVFVIPTPLNLTLIGKYINYTAGGYFASMSISDTTLTLVHSIGDSYYKYTYNSSGILTKFTIGYSGTIFHEMVIETDAPNGVGDGKNEIPFGNTFILISIIGTLIWFISNRRKIIKT